MSEMIAATIGVWQWCAGPAGVPLHSGLAYRVLGRAGTRLGVTRALEVSGGSSSSRPSTSCTLTRQCGFIRQND